MPATEPEPTVALLSPCAEVTTWRLAVPQPAHLGTVNGLARLALAAKRLGWRIEVRGAPADLRQLLELVGLTMLLDLPASGLAGSAERIEMGGEPEEGEEGGLDEAVVPDDPSR